MNCTANRQKKQPLNTVAFLLFNIFSKFLHGSLASIFTFLLYPILKSDLFVSNFNAMYNLIYDNSIWNFYSRNYTIILPIFIILYIFMILLILEKTSYNIKKES